MIPVEDFAGLLVDQEDSYPMTLLDFRVDGIDFSMN
jgi:hypothetical protein